MRAAATFAIFVMGFGLFGASTAEAQGWGGGGSSAQHGGYGQAQPSAQAQPSGQAHDSGPGAWNAGQRGAQRGSGQGSGQVDGASRSPTAGSGQAGTARGSLQGAGRGWSGAQAGTGQASLMARDGQAGTGQASLGASARRSGGQLGSRAGQTAPGAGAPSEQTLRSELADLALGQPSGTVRGRGVRLLADGGTRARLGRGSLDRAGSSPTTGDTRNPWASGHGTPNPGGGTTGRGVTNPSRPAPTTTGRGVTDPGWPGHTTTGRGVTNPGWPGGARNPWAPGHGTPNPGGGTTGGGTTKGSPTHTTTGGGTTKTSPTHTTTGGTTKGSPAHTTTGRGVTNPTSPARTTSSHTTSSHTTGSHTTGSHTTGSHVATPAAAKRTPAKRPTTATAHPSHAAARPGRSVVATQRAAGSPTHTTTGAATHAAARPVHPAGHKAAVRARHPVVPQRSGLPPVFSPLLWLRVLVPQAGYAPASAVRAAVRRGVPLLAVVALGLVLLAQAFVDRKDPRLANARRRSDDDGVSFR